MLAYVAAGLQLRSATTELALREPLVRHVRVVADVGNLELGRGAGLEIGHRALMPGPDVLDLLDRVHLAAPHRLPGAVEELLPDDEVGGLPDPAPVAREVKPASILG